MNIFSIISLQPNPALEAKIAAVYPLNYFRLSDTNWLIAASGTAQDVSAALGLVAGQFDSTVVIGMSNYHGRAPVPIWDWIKAKLEAPVHG